MSQSSLSAHTRDPVVQLSPQHRFWKIHELRQSLISALDDGELKTLNLVSKDTITFTVGRLWEKGSLTRLSKLRSITGAGRFRDIYAPAVRHLTMGSMPTKLLPTYKTIRQVFQNVTLAEVGNHMTISFENSEGPMVIRKDQITDSGKNGIYGNDYHAAKLKLKLPAEWTVQWAITGNGTLPLSKVDQQSGGQLLIPSLRLNIHRLELSGVPLDTTAQSLRLRELEGFTPIGFLDIRNVTNTNGIQNLNAFFRAYKCPFSLEFSNFIPEIRLSDAWVDIQWSLARGLRSIKIPMRLATSLNHLASDGIILPRPSREFVPLELESFHLVLRVEPMHYTHYSIIRAAANFGKSHSRSQEISRFLLAVGGLNCRYTVTGSADDGIWKAFADVLAKEIPLGIKNLKIEGQ